MWRFDDKMNGSSGAVPVFWMGQFLIGCANGAWRSPRMNPADGHQGGPVTNIMKMCLCGTCNTPVEDDPKYDGTVNDLSMICRYRILIQKRSLYIIIYKISQLVYFKYSGVPNNHTGMLIYFGQKCRVIVLLF